MFRLVGLCLFSFFDQGPGVLRIYNWYSWNSKIEFSGQTFWVGERRV